MNNTINWFEIPCADLDRATSFYEKVTGRTLKRESFMGVPHAIFATSDKEAVTGALVQDPRNAPSSNGAVVYLNAGKDLEGWVTRAKKAGVEILVPVTDIGEPGFIALVKDTEGNRVGFHGPR